MRLSAFVTVAASILLTVRASAVVTPTQVMEVPTLDDLKTCCASYVSVNVRGNFAPDDGGGGHFVAEGSSCSNDEGVVIKETISSPRCWYRQFWGPVHLAWYGVPDATGYIPGSTTVLCREKPKVPVPRFPTSTQLNP